ncbi:MAG: AtpZ/AtpI family protein [Clostridia bacterium]|nr:AtpZ/AtpI family protein [Clostridia bacterium]
MAAMLFLGFYGGRWLDRRLGTEPFFMIAGVLLGAGLAFKSLLDELGVLSRESKREENGEQKQGRNGY